MVTTRSKRSLLTDTPAESTLTEAAQALSNEANVTNSPSEGDSNESRDKKGFSPLLDQEEHDLRSAVVRN
jgi:hypothetical protein